MTTTALSNIEIDLEVRQHAHPHYGGIYSIDNIPYGSLMKTNRPFIIICNLSRKEETGTHFVTVVKSDNNAPLIFLDTLARIIIHPNFLKFNLPIVAPIKTPVQTPTSRACGYYCIFYTLYFNRLLSNRSIPNSLIPFSNPHLNDAICIHNISVLQNVDQ